MGCLTIGTSSFEIFSYLFSAYYGWLALQLGHKIYTNWQTFTNPDFNRTAQSWANSAAFLIAVPPAVLVHEFFHAFAIWGYGGRVVNCGYGFYWGFVQADRFFSPSQEWVIAIMGTVGSLLFGLVVWLALRNHETISIRYFALRALRFQIYFALIYYPLFTVFLGIGDWRTIYNFAETPVLSGLTVIPHLLLLGLFWWWDRNGRFEPATFFAQPIANKPMEEQLQTIQQVWQSDSTATYNKLVDQFAQEHPDHLETYMLRTQQALNNKQNITEQAVRYADKALEQKPSNPARVETLYYVKITHAKQLRQLDEALKLIAQAEAHLKDEPDILLNRIRFERAVIYRQQNRYNEALVELKRLRDIAHRHKKDTEPYDREIALVERHRRQ